MTMRYINRHYLSNVW